MNEMAAVKQKRIRFLILKITAPEHPMPLDAVIIRRCLMNHGYPIPMKDLESHLAYLAEKQMVKLEERRDYGITLASITAKGLDVVEGRTTDPGIDGGL